MNLDFLRYFLDRTGFSAEAGKALMDSARRLSGFVCPCSPQSGLKKAVEAFYQSGLKIELAKPFIEAAADRSGIHPYTLWLLFLIEAAIPARQAYAQKGIADDIFWDTFTDLRYKADECQAMYGVWGNFVSSWYPIFYSCSIVKLGRLEYENTVYPWDEPYMCRSVTVRKGDPVKSIHIPSSREPFDRASRLDSYRRAWDFFQKELQDRPLICTCHSWLLYPQNRQILSPSSRVVDFMGDFDLLRAEPDPAFSNGWRVFGPDCQLPPDRLPERTSMQRAFKRWLCGGNVTGYGFGILIFDGNSIVSAP